MSDVEIWGFVLAATIVTSLLISAALWSVMKR